MFLKEGGKISLYIDTVESNKSSQGLLIQWDPL